MSEGLKDKKKKLGNHVDIMRRKGIMLFNEGLK
jgi:hypothetical protein